MQSITFECEVITPMFLAGADGRTPELRPPSIKGALRFWWRALNGHLVSDENGTFDFTELKLKEGEIFGDTNERSSIIIQPCKVKKIEEIKISNTPHHNNSYCHRSNNNCNYRRNSCSKSIKRNARFYTFDLNLRYNSNRISEEDIKHLVVNTFLLGGIGNRSRRGFGSIKIKNNPIFNNTVSLKEHLKSITKSNENKGYPNLKSIKVGKEYNSYEQVLIAIGKSSHKNAHTSLGHTKKRFASPIYTTVFKTDNNKYFPIITTLNTVDDANNRHKIPTNQQTNYIKLLSND